MMHTAGTMIAELKRRGELWEPAPGHVALRGDAAMLHAALDGRLRELCVVHGGEEWHVPPAVSFETLARADYFASFPQWLTAAAHLAGDNDTLARIADAGDPASAAVSALTATPIALQPAACYHVYAALAGGTLTQPLSCAVAGTCWRHEAGRFAPLERGWSFTMREAVCAGDEASIAAFRARGIVAARHLAEGLGLRAHIAEAADPFFAPSTRGRSLMQQLKSLKHELHLPLGGGRSVAAASFNDHADFFGRTFGILMANGAPAATGCVAFGVERWVLAVLVEHGPDACNWPESAVSSTSELTVSASGRRA